MGKQHHNFKFITHFVRQQGIVQSIENISISFCTSNRWKRCGQIVFNAKFGVQRGRECGFRQPAWSVECLQTGKNHCFRWMCQWTIREWTWRRRQILAVEEQVQWAKMDAKNNTLFPYKCVWNGSSRQSEWLVAAAVPVQKSGPTLFERYLLTY